MQEFNKGVYDYIIATDESGASQEHDSEEEQEEEEVEEEENEECNLIITSPKFMNAVFLTKL